MLTDVVLREAAAEAERFLLSIVPEEGEPHVFSKRFERKMQKLIRRANHPVRYQVLRAAAAVVIAIATLFGTVMAVSPETRAAVVGWLKETFSIYTHYSNDHMNIDNNLPANGSQSDGDNPEEQMRHEYCLPVIPEGYWEVDTIDRLDGRMYIYANNADYILCFVYTYGAENGSLFVDTKNYEQYSAYIHGSRADIYIPLSDDETSVIIWQDPQGVLFEIYAKADQTELIELAEGVSKIIP